MSRVAFFYALCVLLAGNALAATYYVKPNGSDSADGKSDATAWKTIGKVNNFPFQPGDDVYFKCGGTWTGAVLRINWNGVDENNRAVIGAYYVQDGMEKIGVSGNKPVFDGKDTLPSSQSLGLINLADHREYVTIENLRLINSEGHGVVAGNYPNYVNVKNIETYNTYNGAIKYSNATGGVIEGCTITNSGRKQIEDGSDRPALIAVNNASRDVTIQKNYVYNNYGEGIGLYKATHDCVIQDNVTVDNVGANIYVDAGQGIVIRRNMVYNTRSNKAAGITLSDEGRVSDFPQGVLPCNRNKIHNNFVAYTQRGIVLTGGRAGSTTQNCEVYNNTIVACRDIGLDFPVGPYENNIVKNNIVWCGTPGDSYICSVGNSVTHGGGIVFGSNYYSSAPDSDMQAVTDIGYPSYENGAPKIKKTSGWQSLDLSLNYADFAPVDGSPLIDSGTDLGDAWSQLLDPQKSWFDYANPINSVAVLGDQREQGLGWEIGAAVYVIEMMGIALEPPANVRVIND